MTADPGDLVFDPACGSGATADTSHVALAIARQRLMTAKFDFYELNDPAGKHCEKHRGRCYCRKISTTESTGSVNLFVQIPLES